MIYEIIQKLGSDNSRLFKESVMKDNSGNDVFKRVCEMTYNPMRVYGIRKIPSYTPNELIETVTLCEALDYLEQLIETRRVTGNKAIEGVRDMLEGLKATDAKVFEMVLKGDFDVGVSTSTINKTWPNLIPKYPCLLAQPDKEKTRANIKFPAIAQVKCDGMRINAHVTETKVNYFSRNGKPVDANFEELDNELINIRNRFGFDVVIDGEMLCQNNDGTWLDRKTGNGICNKAVKGTISEAERETFRIIAWDFIPMADFLKGEYDLPYSDRYEWMKDEVKGEFVELVETRVVADWEEATAFYDEAYSSGEEGLIIKNTSGIWEDKRSKDCVKMKAELVCELEVIDIKEGTGKYEGKLGAIVCKSAGADPILVNVGSGFTDADRELGRDDLVGKIVSVKYNEIIKSKGSKERSLFLPIFMGIREDKDEADVL